MTLLSSAPYTNGHQPDRLRLGHKARSGWATSTPVRSVLKLRRMAVRAVSSATGPTGPGSRFGQLLILLSGGAQE
jgi:hypothetical protein